LNLGISKQELQSPIQPVGELNFNCSIKMINGAVPLSLINFSFFGLIAHLTKSNAETELEVNSKPFGVMILPKTQKLKSLPPGTVVIIPHVEKTGNSDRNLSSQVFSGSQPPSNVTAAISAGSPLPQNGSEANVSSGPDLPPNGYVIDVPPSGPRLPQNGSAKTLSGSQYPPNNTTGALPGPKLSQNATAISTQDHSSIPPSSQSPLPETPAVNQTLLTPVIEATNLSSSNLLAPPPPKPAPPIPAPANKASNVKIILPVRKKTLPLLLF
jgi:hypothetical protein